MGILTTALLAMLSVQDDAAMKMEWVVVDGDRFDLTWSYKDQRKREPGLGEVTEAHDNRDVVAELNWKSQGILSMTLKKVVWNYGTQDFEVTWAYVEGKKSDPQIRMKIAEKVTRFANSKIDAERWVEIMKQSVTGEYLFDVGSEQGRTQVTWNGGSVRSPGGQAVIQRIFTHPLLPSGPVRVGQIFKDPLDVTNLTAGLTDIKDVESKVTAVGDKGLIAKGGVTIPFGKSIVANSQTQVMTGTFTYTCEWNFSPQSYLQGAREESKFSKKVDAKGKDADFYRDNVTHTIAQALSIKKKPADPNRKPAPKPEEPKAPEGDK